MRQRISLMCLLALSTISQGSLVFKVAPVTLANVTYQPIALNLGTTELQEEIGKQSDTSLYFESGETNFPLIKVPVNKVEHAFMSTVFEAYNRHLPLELGPDDFWTLIAQGVASYLGTPEVAEEHRSKFVSHQGKKELLVRLFPSDANERGTNVRKEVWPSVVNRFSDEIKKATATNLTQVLTKGFSTSKSVEKVVLSGTLMTTMKNYFRYVGGFMCGIPEVTLHGTRADYLDILGRLGEIEKVFPQLKWWTRKVERIMTKVLNTIQGNRDTDWWRTMIFEVREGSGGKKKLTGWVGDFMPFAGGSNGPGLTRNEGLSLDNLPHGVSLAEVILRWPGGREIAVKLATGFVGTHQNPRTLALRPAMGWMVFNTQNL